MNETQAMIPFPGMAAVTALSGTRARAVMVLTVVALLTLLACGQLGRLELDVSTDGFRLEGDPAVEVYDETGRLFANERTVVILLRDVELFGRDQLTAIHEAQQRLAGLKSVAEVESLFNVPYARVVDDFIHTGPYIESPEMTESEIRSLIEAANENPFLSGTLISRDGKAMAMHLTLSDDAKNARTVHGEIEQALEPLRDRLDEALQSNPERLELELQDQIVSDIVMISPIALAILFAAMMLCCRSARLAWLPLLTSGISIVWLFGLLPTLGLSVNILTSLVPALLVIVGSTEDIHLIAEYRAARAGGQSGTGALSTMLRRMMVITAITALTSLIGIASIMANPIEMLREFSLVASLGLALNYLITIVFVPAYLNCTERESGMEHRLKSGWLSVTDCVRYDAFLVRHRMKIVLAACALIPACLLFVTDLRVDSRLADFMTGDSESLQALTRLEETMSGVDLVRIVIDGPGENAFRDPAWLEQVSRLQHHLRTSKSFTHSVSLVDLIALSYSLVNDSGEAELPQNRSIIDELLLFIDDEKRARFVDRDFNRTVVLARHSLLSSQDLSREIADLEQYIRTNLDKRLHVTVTGKSVITDHAVGHIASGQLLSLLVTLTLVFLIGSWMTGEAKAGFVAVFVNALPLSVMFCTMSLAGLTFNFSTAMVATIAFGISVDYTLHFLQRYRHLRTLFADDGMAMAQTIQQESQAIITTTLTLTAGMCSFMLSSFPSVVTFGLLSLEVVFVAFIANFTITPLLVRMLGVQSRSNSRIDSGEGRRVVVSP